MPLVVGFTGLGGGSGSAAKAFWKMDPRRVSWSSEVLLSWCGKCPLIKLASLPAAAMTASSGVVAPPLEVVRAAPPLELVAPPLEKQLRCGLISGAALLRAKAAPRGAVGEREGGSGWWSLGGRGE